MFIELQVIRQLMASLRARLALLRVKPESGEVAEKVILVALFVMLALAAGGIIYTKVIAKANSINTGN